MGKSTKSRPADMDRADASAEKPEKGFRLSRISGHPGQSHDFKKPVDFSKFVASNPTLSFNLVGSLTRQYIKSQDKAKDKARLSSMRYKESKGLKQELKSQKEEISLKENQIHEQPEVNSAAELELQTCREMLRTVEEEVRTAQEEIRATQDRLLAAQEDTRKAQEELYTTQDDASRVLVELDIDDHEVKPDRLIATIEVKDEELKELRQQLERVQRIVQAQNSLITALQN